MTMRTISPEHIEAVLALANSSPFNRLAGISVVSISPGRSEIEVDVTRGISNSMGSIHGGAYATMLDALTYWAVYCDVGEGDGLVTVDLHVHDISSVRSIEGARLRGVGKALKMGRTLCISEGRIEDEEGRLLAFGTSTVMILPGRGDLIGPSLPPKFLDDAMP